MAQEEEVVRDFGWIAIQKRTFTRWVNQHLSERMIKLEDLFEDLNDGIYLINLLEIISNKKIPNYNKKPKIRAQKLENNSFALNFLKQENIKLVAIGPEDIVDKNSKLILGLIWTIILRYHIQKGDGSGSAKNELLQWVRRQIPECDVTNFTTSWSDGKAVCHLVESLQKGLIPLDEVDANPDALANATLGEDTAEKELGIPKVLLPEDMVHESPDELSVMTYISYYRDYLDNLAKRRSLAEKEKIAVPEKTIAYGAGLQEGEQYIPTEFLIQAKNCFGNDCPASGETFEVVIKSPKKGTVPVQIIDHNNDDGKYTVHYTPVDAGRHVITVQLKGKPISGSPFNVPVNKTSVQATGAGLEKAEQYTPATFVIHANKLFEAKVPATTAEFDVKISGPKQPVEAHLEDNKDGTFTVTYTPTEAGRHVVNVQLHDRPIANGPFSVAVDKTLCLASGPGLERGEQFVPGVFTIEARNLFASGHSNGVADFEVNITAPKGRLTPEIVDNKDGTFTVTYVPEESGRFNIAINLRGHPISNGPFSVPISGTGVTASGPGLDKGEQFIPSNFTVNAKPLTDRGVAITPEDIDVKVNGPQGPVDVQITPNDDGTFAVSFTPKDAGRHNIVAAVKGQVIASPSVPVQKTSCTAFGPGLEKGEQFLEGVFTVDASPIVKNGGSVPASDIVVKVNGPLGPVTPHITAHDDGTFKVAYTPKDIGPHSISVSVKGQDIANNSVPVIKTNVTASGPGLEKGEQFIPAHFTIHAANLVKSGFSNGTADFDVKISGPKGTVEPIIKDNGDGTFSVTYTPKDTGRFNIAVNAKGQPINNGPFNVPIDKTTCRAFGPGLEKAEQFIPAEFTVDASPLAKHDILVPTEDIQVRIAGPLGSVESTIVPSTDGTFSVTYQPKDIGKYNVQVTLKGAEIANVLLNVGKTACGASGSGLDKAEQFIPATFQVDARPLIAAGVDVTPEDVVPVITSPTGTVPTEVVPSSETPGVFDVTFTPKDVGPHRVQTSLKGQEILNKPVVVSKTSAGAHGPGLEKGEQFIPAIFTVDASPLFRAGVPAKPWEVEVKVAGPTAPVEPAIIDNEDGTFSVSYVPKEIGRHSIVATLKGQEIAKTSVPVQKTSCTASGPGLEKAEQFVPAVFYIDASPLEANHISLSPEEIDVKITGPQGPIEPLIQKSEDGKFTVQYVPKDIARHSIQVTLKGTPIANASVPVAKTSATVSGPGLEKAEQFIPAVFTVDAKNLANAGVPVVPDDIVVRVTTPNGTPAEVFVVDHETEPGTFVVTYVPNEIGKYGVNVVLKGQEIANRPVFASKTTATASGPGLEKATQFLPATFTVDVSPLAKANVPLAREDVTVKINGPNGPVEARVEAPDHSGHFQVTYVPDDVGRHNVEVFLRGTPIASKAPVASKSGITVNGDGINRAEQYIPSNFAIDATPLKDEGVPATADQFEVKLASPSGDLVPVDIVDNDDGTFTANYTPQEPGRHNLTVSLKGRPILANHVVPVDRSATDPSKSTAEGPGIEPGVILDEPTHFTIQARNKIGEPMKTGGDPFKVEITGPYNSIAEPVVTDNGDGTYRVVYEPNLPGDHVVNVTLNGTPISGAPWTVPVERSDSQPDPSQFDVYGPGLEHGDTADPSTFTIVAKNSKGEQLHQGGFPVFVEIFGPSGAEVFASVLDNDDGTFSVSYQAVDPGLHSVHVILRSKVPLFYDHIKDSPYNVEIVAGTDPSASLVWGPGLVDVFDTKPTEFYIKARDRDGNDMGRGGDPFQVTINGPKGPVPATTTDNGDGTYTVNYEPADHGDHVIQVTLRGKPVANSPYTVAVKEGASWEYTLIERYQFTIRSKTKADTNKLVGGEEFNVSIQDSNSAPVNDISLTDVGDGSYLCDFGIPAPGEYNLSVQLNGHDIRGSPFKIVSPQNNNFTKPL